MSFIVPDEGELKILQYIQAAGLLDGKALRIFQNNITPSAASVIGDFTVATFSGYADNTSVAFGSPSEVSNKAQMVDAAARVFTHNGGGTSNTIYGYYYVDSSATKLLLAERFSAPVTMSTNGDNVSIQMTVKLNGV